MEKLPERKLFSAQEYADEVISGNRIFLSKAITLIESSLPEHRELGSQVIELCLPYSGNSVRVGITGVPGVGKSTFINSLGKHLTELEKKVAVLAIDPSSKVSKGSILGDKTRMEKLTGDANAFIRPSASSGALGGVANATREAIILCEAAGFNIIIVETVGVGQSETEVHSMVDFFLLLMLAGAGDELQGIKRGIMEMADAILINKADGDNINKAKAARAEYAHALHLFPPIASGWVPRAEVCSALTGLGINTAWNIIEEYVLLTKSNSYFEKRRKEQSRQWLHESLNREIKSLLYSSGRLNELIKNLEQDVQEGKRTAFSAAREIAAKFKGDIRA